MEEKTRGEDPHPGSGFLRPITDSRSQKAVSANPITDTDLFKACLTKYTIPSIWKMSIIIPVPKKPRPTELNHYRPVALTSIIVKCLEKLLLKTILPAVYLQLDPLQFAYKAKRGTEDAVACLLHLLLQHLDSPGNFARILFVDFSSAFNSIQSHLMIQKLYYLNIPTRLIHLIYNFLSNRQQVVRLGSTTSSALTINTGAPQGCVLSPLLYTLYTNDNISPSPSIKYLKYSDDTAILALLKDNNSVMDYHTTVMHFSRWCEDNHLNLNVSKTKELIVSSPSPQHPTVIHNQTVEIVNSFKYLGVTLDNTLTFDQHIMDIQKRSHQRLSVIHKLKGLNVAPWLLLLLYQSIILPILLYCSSCFYNMLSVKNRSKLTKVSNIAAKVIGLSTPNLTELNNRAITRIAISIEQDSTHPLNEYLDPLPSGRRYRAMRCRRARFGRSLIPSAITYLNNRHRWGYLNCIFLNIIVLCLLCCVCQISAVLWKRISLLGDNKVNEMKRHFKQNSKNDLK